MTAVASPLSGLCVDLTSCVWVSLGAMVGGGAGMNNSGMSDAEITKYIIQSIWITTFNKTDNT